MITTLLFFFTQAALAASPQPWFDLEVGEQFALSQEIELAGHGFPAGTRLWLESREPISVPGAPMSYYSFYQSPCSQPELEAELEIVVPAGNPESSAVGVELFRGCNWGVYVENKDLFSSSFLSTP